MEMQTTTTDPPTTDGLAKTTTATATATAPPVAKPKLADVEAQTFETEEQKVEHDKVERERTLMTRIIQGSAIATIVINIVAMAIYGGGIVITAGIIGALVSCGVIYFQEELRNEDTLRMVQNELRHKVNAFADENNQLAVTVTKLEEELVPLKETEAKLEQIATKNGGTVLKMKGLLKTNKATLDKMRQSIEADVLNSMMDIVLKADRTEDGILSKSEVSALTLRLKMLPTIEVNEGLLKEALNDISESNRQIAELMILFRQIHDDTVPDEERVFKLSKDHAAAVLNRV